VLPEDKGSFSPTTLQANIDHAVNKALMSMLGSSSGSGSSPGNGNSVGQSGPGLKCYACGKVGYRKYDCPEDNRQRCGHCGKPGHPERECFLKHGMMGKSPQEKAQFLKRQRDEGETEEDPSSKKQARPASLGNGIESTPREMFRRRRGL
jgi:hypothetical protein